MLITYSFSVTNRSELYSEKKKKKKLSRFLHSAMEAKNHKCKLKNLINGEALGGHMKTHHFISAASSSSSFSFSDQKEKEEEKGLVYELRENPKRSFRVADPEFHSAIEAEFVAQDRESETESIIPTRKRSTRNRSSGGTETQNQNQKMKLKELMPEKPTPVESKSEPMSSVSNTSSDEEIAFCLLMLSRDKWETKNEGENGNLQSIKTKKLYRSNESKNVRTKNLCKKCNRLFRSSRALLVHTEICFRSNEAIKNGGNEKIFECSFCERVFGSGQALGGHKRSHLVSSAPAKNSVIDLNLPAAIDEDDDYSVVSDS